MTFGRGPCTTNSATLVRHLRSDDSRTRCAAPSPKTAPKRCAESPTLKSYHLGVACHNDVLTNSRLAAPDVGTNITI